VSAVCKRIANGQASNAGPVRMSANTEPQATHGHKVTTGQGVNHVPAFLLFLLGGAAELGAGLLIRSHAPAAADNHSA
jgi:hypothetical protein